MQSIVFLLGLLLISSSVQAMNIDWSGLYRIEALRIKNSELDNVERNKSYINHHLILKPKITAADGLNIHGRFDIFNNSGLSNSQFGQFFGDGIGNTTNNSEENSNVLSQNQADETLLVTQLYLTYDFEFTTVIAGRAPLNFGLGLTHNSGDGLFDHWYDNRDLIAAEFVMGNLVFTPIFAKVSEGELDIGDDVRDYIFRLDYDNPETETGFGIMYQVRRAGLAGNDFPIAAIDAAAGTAPSEGFEGENINFFFKRGWDTFNFALEGGFSKGNTGFKDSNNADISRDGFGVAIEMNYQAQGSEWSWDLLTGFASGDDPSTTNKVEGFFFDRNYDVGILLFNHVLGQFDALNSSLARDTTLNLQNSAINNGNAGSVPDVEVLTSAVYFAPGFNKKMNDRWSWGGRLIYAVLTEDTATVNNVSTKIESDLGIEIDFNLQFKPHERFTWITEVAAFLPGKAFEGAGTFDSEFAYGVITKAAINF